MFCCCAHKDDTAVTVPAGGAAPEYQEDVQDVWMMEGGAEVGGEVADEYEENWAWEEGDVHAECVDGNWEGYEGYEGEWAGGEKEEWVEETPVAPEVVEAEDVPSIPEVVETEKKEPEEVVEVATP